MSTQDKDHSESVAAPSRSMVEGALPEGMLVVGQGSPVGQLAWNNGSPPPPEILSIPFDWVWLFHSLRRRWVWASVLSILFGALGAWLVYFFFPPEVTAVAALKVTAETPKLLFEMDQGKDEDFETFKRTQAALVIQHFVLSKALGQGGIGQLNMVRAEDDPIDWLRDELDVDYPGNSEILQIRLQGEDAEETVRIVNAVQQAYLQEVVFKDRDEKLETKALLERSYRETADELHRQNELYQTKARDYGTIESDHHMVDRTISQMRLGYLAGKLQQLEDQQGVELVNAKLIQTQVENPDLIDADIEARIMQDPLVYYIQNMVYQAEYALMQAQGQARRRGSPALRRAEASLRGVSAQLKQRKDGLRSQLKLEMSNASNPMADYYIQASEIKLGYYAQFFQRVQQQYDQEKEYFRKLTARSLELEELLMAIFQLRRVSDSMAHKIETWDIELQAPDRIQKIQDAVAMPGLDTWLHVLLVSMGGIAGVSLCCLGIGYLEFRAKRLNASYQIDEGLGIRVVGALPSLADRRQGDDASDPVLAMLIESIDSVRTTLIHASASKETRVVIVTSASGQEGRTTVASQLAASLARAGRRTLLVDGDLRQPTLHGLFEVALEDGLSEVLRTEVDVMDIVRPTHNEGLWLLTAGDCDVDALRALAKDQLQPVIEKLRDEYDFIIVDTAPILDLSDSFIMAQYADGVILSVLRDVSQVPKIHQARELLRSIGVRILGSVVNGVPTQADERVERVSLLSAHDEEHDVAVAADSESEE